MYDFPRWVERERERERDAASVVLFSAVPREMVPGCFHLLQSHRGKMYFFWVGHIFWGWLAGRSNEKTRSVPRLPWTINQCHITHLHVLTQRHRVYPKEPNVLVQAGQSCIVCPHCRWTVYIAWAECLVCPLVKGMMRRDAVHVIQNQIMLMSSSSCRAFTVYKEQLLHLSASLQAHGSLPLAFCRGLISKLKLRLYCINWKGPWDPALCHEESSADVGSVRNVAGWGSCERHATKFHFSLSQTFTARYAEAASGIK